MSLYIRENYGIYLKENKKILVEGRLNTVLEELGFSSFSEYIDFIVADKSGKAVTELINKITTNHTFFMREADHFTYFKDKVMPELSISVKDKDLRIWSAACSTGEEPYTLAILLDEFFGRNKMYWDAKVLATDISDHVLSIAQQGMYSMEQLQPLPVTWKMNYFQLQHNGNYMVKDALKNEVIFRKFNLNDNAFPFKKKFHVIFCRNVMIYFNEETKKRLINRLYDALANGGYLFIGHSETVDRQDGKFKYVIPSVYQKV